MPDAEQTSSGPSSRDTLRGLMMLGQQAQNFTVADECKRIAEQMTRASHDLSTPEDERYQLRELAETIMDAGTALEAVTGRCVEVLDKVGASDKPVAKALRDLALDIKRKARGRYAYL